MVTLLRTNLVCICLFAITATACAGADLPPPRNAFVVEDAPVVGATLRADGAESVPSGPQTARLAAR